MDDRIKYHIRKHIIRRAAYLLIVCGILAVAFLLGSQGNSTDFDGYRFLLMCILAGLFEIIYCVKNSLRFVRMIRRQEDASGVQFDDTDALTFSKGSFDIIAGDWFIRPGCYAFYRGCISAVSSRNFEHVRVNGRRLGIRITVKTTDGKRYRFGFQSKEDAEKFLTWSGHGD